MNSIHTTSVMQPFMLSFRFLTSGGPGIADDDSDDDDDNNAPPFVAAAPAAVVAPAAAHGPALHDHDVVDFGERQIHVFASEDGQCVICMAAEANVLLLDCGHFVMCAHCAARSLVRRHPRCPVCRAAIDLQPRVY